MSYFVKDIGESCYKVDSVQIENSHSKKLLGVIIDNKLSFQEDTKTLYGKARSKLSALSKIARFMKCSKRKLLINIF